MHPKNSNTWAGDGPGGGPPKLPSILGEEKVRQDPPKINTFVDFYGRDFIISKDVLIPRPETEMIIDTVLNLVGKSYLPGVKPSPAKLPKQIKVVDVGTGSGCIAITLKLEIPEIDITAVDISPRALGVALKNQRKFGADIRLIHSDLLEKIDSLPNLVVANLPYVDKNWDWVDQEALSKEPEIALYAEDRGLALIKRLIEQVSQRMIPYLLLEADPCQHDEIVAFANKKGLDHVETRGFAILLDNPQALH